MGIKIEEQNPVREMVMELIDRCPMHLANPEFCPLHGLRLLPNNERQAWLDSLSDEEVDKLAVYHWVCLEEKLLRWRGTS